MTLEISLENAKKAFEDESALFIDIRDQNSFNAAHVPGAQHVDSKNLDNFIENTPKDKKVIVYCYQGNSSKTAVEFLRREDFEDVHSMEGGFELWRKELPTE